MDTEEKIYNKLVRDKIPEIIEQDGHKPVHRIAENEEYEQKLIEKFHEEFDEFKESGSVEELADILEVLHALALVKNTTIEQINKIRIEKTINRGSFNNKVILEKIIYKTQEEL